MINAQKILSLIPTGSLHGVLIKLHNGPTGESAVDQGEVCVDTSSKLNKYFELKKSWGCCHNSNYLLTSVVRGKNITQV